MRLKFNLVLVLAAILCAATPAFSQNDFKPFSHMSLGVKASTLGYGFEVATPLNKMMALRMGVNLTGGITFGEYNTPFNNLTDEDFTDRFGYEPDFRAKPEINLTHGNLLVDFQPIGFFHLTAGFFVGTSKFKLTGSLVDHYNNPAILRPGYEWPHIEVGDERIDLTGGHTNAELQLGNTFKPYVGLGFGRAVAKKHRVTFMFEVGALYQGGNYTFKQDGRVLDLSVSTQDELQDVHDALTKYTKFWPMINFQLAYRIF